MEFQIYTGESIAESLTALGLPSAFIDKTITCTTIKYHFNLENITKLPKVRRLRSCFLRLATSQSKCFLAMWGISALNLHAKRGSSPNL